MISKDFQKINMSKEFSDNMSGEVTDLKKDLATLNLQIETLGDALIENSNDQAKLDRFQELQEEKKVLLTQLRLVQEKTLGKGHKEVQNTALEFEKTKSRFGGEFSLN